jgi:hypothetical protein
MRTITLDLDDEREARLAGLMILEAVDDPTAWRRFWASVDLARRRHHQTRSHYAEDDRATTGSGRGSSAPGAPPTGRRRPARGEGSGLSLTAELPAEPGTEPQSPGPEHRIPGDQ